MDSDRILSTVALFLTYAVIALMLTLLIGGALARRGSLDNLPADKIKEAVDAAKER